MRRLRKLDRHTVRAALWAVRALRRARVVLRSGAPTGAALPTPPALPPHAERGVRLVLRRSPTTCLERALVLQAWLAARGDRRDVVIGVRGPTSGFAAHAWVEGEQDRASSSFDELARLPAA